MKAIVTFISAIIPLFVLTSQVHAKPPAESPNKVADGKWFTDFKEAKKQATKEELPIFLFFTGSDWCPPCKVIKKEIFSTKLFKNAVKNKWVLLEVDLPNDESKIEAEILEQNKLLQGYFEITSFPTILALNSDGKPLANIPRYNDPAVFVKGMEPYLKVRSAFNQYLQEASAVEGEAKAEALANALSLVTEEQVRFHTESIETLRALVEKGEGEVAKPLLAKIKKQKDRMEEDARKRTLEPEYEKQGKEGWMTDYDAAKAKAKREGKFLFIHFMNPSRTAPKVMLNNVYYQPEFKKKAAEKWVLLEMEYAGLGKMERAKNKTAEAKRRAEVWDIYTYSVYPSVSVCAFPDGRPFSINHYWSASPLEFDEFQIYIEGKEKEGREFLEQIERAKASEGLVRAKILNDLFYPHLKYRLERPSDFLEQYDPEIKLLLEADPEFNQPASKLALLEPLYKKKDINRFRKVISEKELSDLWVEMGTLATRYFDEHDTTDFPKLRSRLFYIQAHSYAYQGDKEKSDKAIKSLLSKKLANTPGRHQRFIGAEHNIDFLKKEVEQGLKFSRK